MSSTPPRGRQDARPALNHGRRSFKPQQGESKHIAIHGDRQRNQEIAHRVALQRIAARSPHPPIDIAGPLLESRIGRFRYLMLLIDDSTYFRVAIPMRSREEGSANIRGFVSRFNALAGASGGRIARVGSILSDGAKELVSNEMQEYLDDHGADKKESPPGVSAVNGCAERGILSVFQIVRAQFEQAGAPRTFWPEAVASAVDILNRTSIAPHGRCSSYENLTGQAPRVMSIMPWGCCAWAVKQTRCKTTIDSTAMMGINLGRSERQPGAYIIWIQAELRAVSKSDALFDETLFPWRPKGHQRPEDPPPLPGDGDAAQPPTLPPADEAQTNHSRIKSNLAVEFARASQKGPHLAPRIGAACLSRRVLILFSGPYTRPDGLVAFMQRLGLEIVPVDNDSSGGDKAHDLLRIDFYSDLLRRAQRGEFLVIWAAPPCSTFRPADSYQRERPAAAHRSFVVDKKGKPPVHETFRSKIIGSSRSRTSSHLGPSQSCEQVSTQAPSADWKTRSMLAMRNTRNISWIVNMPHSGSCPR